MVAQTASAPGSARRRLVGVQVPVLQLGLPDRFVEHGDPVRLMHECGLDAEGIEQSVRRRFGPSLAVVRSTTVANG